MKPICVALMAQSFYLFLNTLIWARQKSSVLSLTLIFLLYFYIEPSLVQRLVPGWLQNIYKHSLIVIVPRHTMFSYSVSHWKLPLCLISVTGRKNLIKFPCETQNTLMSVFLKVQMLCTQCACKCFRATFSDRMKTSFRSDSNVACYATFCYLKTEYLQMTLLWCSWSRFFLLLVARNLSKKYSPKRGSKEEQECR